MHVFEQKYLVLDIFYLKCMHLLAKLSSIMEFEVMLAKVNSLQDILLKLMLTYLDKQVLPPSLSYHIKIDLTLFNS